MRCWLPPLSHPQRCHINKFDVFNNMGKKGEKIPGRQSVIRSQYVCVWGGVGVDRRGEGSECEEG